MKDEAEQSIPSRGSHGEPDAWAVVLADGQRIYDVYGIEEEAKAIDEAVTGNHGIVPLFRSPSLTDAEREALEWAARSAIAWTNEAARCKSALSRIALSDRTAKRHFAAIRGLVERTK